MQSRRTWTRFFALRVAHPHCEGKDRRFIGMCALALKRNRHQEGLAWTQYCRLGVSIEYVLDVHESEG